MKFILSIILCAFVAVYQSDAQTERSSVRTSDQTIDIEKMVDSTLVYLFDNYIKAKAYYSNQQMDVELNYRLLVDEFIVRSSGSSYQTLNSKNLDSIITVDNRYFSFKPEIGFVEKIDDKENRFFIKFQTTFTMTEMKPGAYGNASPTASTQSVQHLGRLGGHAGHTHTSRDFYLQNSSGNEVQINLTSRPLFIIYHDNEYKNIRSRRDLTRIFPRNKRSEINSYIKNEDISFDVRNDLIKLAHFLEKFDS